MRKHPIKLGPVMDRRFAVDDQPSITARAFYAINNFASEDWAALHSLEIGETYQIGGGASATFLIRRVK